MANVVTMETIQKGGLESFPYAAILTDELAKLGVTISSVENTEIIGDEEMTISSVTKNSSVYIGISGESEGVEHAINTVIQYRAAGGTYGNHYRVRFKATLSDGSIMEVVQPFEVVGL
jgi:hypothetical protein